MNYKILILSNLMAATCILQSAEHTAPQPIASILGGFLLGTSLGVCIKALDAKISAQSNYALSNHYHKQLRHLCNEHTKAIGTINDWKEVTQYIQHRTKQELTACYAEHTNRVRSQKIARHKKAQHFDKLALSMAPLSAACALAGGGLCVLATRR